MSVLAHRPGRTILVEFCYERGDRLLTPETAVFELVHMHGRLCRLFDLFDNWMTDAFRLLALQHLEGGKEPTLQAAPRAMCSASADRQENL
jgi:hypothetical protein